MTEIEFTDDEIILDLESIDLTGELVLGEYCYIITNEAFFMIDSLDNIEYIDNKYIIVNDEKDVLYLTSEKYEQILPLLKEYFDKKLTNK